MPRKRHPAKYDAGRDEWSRKQRYALPASKRRTLARMEAEDRFYRQLSKEREIDVDPIHLHSSTRRMAEFFENRTYQTWLKQSREWDRKYG